MADDQCGHVTRSIDCLQSDVEVNCVLGKYEMISVGPGIWNAVLDINMISRVNERRLVHGEKGIRVEREQICNWTNQDRLHFTEVWDSKPVLRGQRKVFAKLLTGRRERNGLVIDKQV